MWIIIGLGNTYELIRNPEGYMISLTNIYFSSAIIFYILFKAAELNWHHDNYELAFQKLRTNLLFILNRFDYYVKDKKSDISNLD